MLRKYKLYSINLWHPRSKKDIILMTNIEFLKNLEICEFYEKYHNLMNFIHNGNRYILYDITDFTLYIDYYNVCSLFKTYSDIILNDRNVHEIENILHFLCKSFYKINVINIDWINVFYD